MKRNACGRTALAGSWSLALAMALAVGPGGVGCGGGGEEQAAPAQEEMPAEPSAEPEQAEPEEAPMAEAEGGDAAAAEARQIFATRCTTCHGPEGMGDGPGSAGLDPKPRTFHDADWQASVTDDHIAKIIQYGGAAVGKSPTMPGNPDLISKPQVVAALVAHVRSLGSQ
jgi:mono/diheme cytochrome c family protein